MRVHAKMSIRRRTIMVIQRDIYLNKLIYKKHNGLIKVVTGVRRCGKSYLLFHLFKDYLLSRHLPLWDRQHFRYQKMHEFTKAHNRLEDYEPFFQRWNNEEMANIGYTLCCQIDVMMNGYLATLEERFKKEGGMKERMYRVRTGFRAEQDRKMKEMEATIRQQAERIKELEEELEKRKREETRGKKD